MDVQNLVLIFLKKEILEDDTVEIKAEDQLLTTGLVDSLGLMRMVRHLEKQYKINIPFEDITLENFMSINSIKNYIQRKII